MVALLQRQTKHNTIHNYCCLTIQQITTYKLLLCKYTRPLTQKSTIDQTLTRQRVDTTKLCKSGMKLVAVLD